MVASSQEAAAQPALSPPMNVDEHIAKLKEAARNTSPDGTARAGAYLPPVEVARSIPCRYFPNCSRAGCIFYHPTPAAPSTSETLDPSSGQQNGASTGKRSPITSVASNLGASSGNGHIHQNEAQNGSSNGYSSNGNGYDVNAAMQQQAEQQMHMSAMYYSQGYDPNAEYMHYANQNPYMSAHQQQAAYYGYPQYPQQNQQAAYQQYPNPYYAQQGMYASVPPMAYAPQQGHYEPSFQPQQSNGQSQADPAIISQGSKRTSPSHPSAALNSAPAPSAEAATMTKSASSSSNKSNKSAKKTATAVTAASTSEPTESASAPTNTNVVQQPTSPSVQSPKSSQQQQILVYSPPPQSMSPSYYPMGMPMPAEMIQQQQQYMYGSSAPASSQQNQDASARSQNQLEADFARASLNGSQSHQQQNGEAAKKHERSSSAQMRTLYQTGGDSSAPSGNVAGPISPSSYHTPIPTNSLSASTARPIHTGPRLHESQNQGPMNNADFAGHRRELSSSMNGIPTGPKRPFAPAGGPGAPRPAGAPQRNGARHFDPRGPLPACRYFAEGNCRFGDNCHFVHQMNHSRPFPNDPEGKMTSDAKLLKQNIGNPDGGIALMKPRTSKEAPQGGRYGFNGTVMPPAPMNGQAPARFAQANGFHAPEQKKEGQALNGNPEEQFQKLIAEMPRSAGQPAQAAQAPARNQQASPAAPQQQAPRSNPIPPTLGHRPNSTPAHKQAGPFSHNNRASHGQRIPNGENDFPALLASSVGPNGMERSASASSSGAPAPAASSEAKAADGPSESSAAVASPAATPAVEKKEEVANTTPSTAAVQTPSTGATSAPAKPAFSWASAAAKAASLPDPPKRSISKARPAAPSAAASKEAESAPASATAGAPAVQALNAEATAAPAVKA